MMDPIGAFDGIRDNFLLYLKTAFGTRFPSLEKEREVLLRQPGILYQDPWIEPLPKYRTSGKFIRDLTKEDLPGLSDQDQLDFKSLISCGLFGDYQMHLHQVSMLKEALNEKNCIVTAGTGSGKTEAFLLPLFAYLARESSCWETPGIPEAHFDDWWKNYDWQNACKMGPTGNKNTYRVKQRVHEKREAAVRALIIYPMNALVEDQMTRLRKSLDSDNARSWFKNNRNGNRIYFGRYNGNTPVPGHEFEKPNANGIINPDWKRIEKLAESIRNIESNALAAAEYAETCGKNNEKEVIFNFPRLGGSEMLSRWDMQDYPPDILITNFSMLSIMLMREADSPIFEKTRKWLEGGTDRIFHLVIDELHLFRGTAGAEVGYLLRLLLFRLGLSPGHPQLRILGSSASLDPDNSDSLKFLTGFFGAPSESFCIIPGYQEAIPEINGSRYLPHEPFVLLSKADSEFSKLGDKYLEASRLLGFEGNGLNGELALKNALGSDKMQIVARLLHACESGSVTRAVSLDDFARNLFGEEINEIERRNAVHGLFIARNICDVDYRNDPLPQFRLHFFFRNIEGLWASSKPIKNVSDGRTAGKLYHAPRIICDTGEGRRVVELLYCEHCGTVYFGGSRLELGDQGIEMLATDPDIEGIPDKQTARFVERRTYKEFAVFWPVGDSSQEGAESWNQPARFESLSGDAKWIRASLDTRSGKVERYTHEKCDEDPENWIKGYLFEIESGDEGQMDSFSALPSVCACCGADHTKRKYRKSPIRGFRTGFSKVSQIFTKELFYRLPENARKLVVFSDSREDSAQISNGVERNHYLDLLRESVIHEMIMLAIGEPQLLCDLEQNNTEFGQIEAEFLLDNPEIDKGLLKDLKRVSRPIPDDLDEDDRETLQMERNKSQKKLNDIRQRGNLRIVSVNELIQPNSNSNLDCGRLISRFIRIGVNPAGNDLDVQRFWWDKSNHSWKELFDFEKRTWKRGLPQEAEVAKGTIRAKLFDGLCDLFFGRLYFSLESSGLGYAKLRVDSLPIFIKNDEAGLSRDLFEQACDSVIRILGDLYRHDGSEYRQNDWSCYGDAPARGAFKKFIRELSKKLKCNEQTVGNELFNALRYGGHQNGKISANLLNIRVAIPEDPVWLCPNCCRPHLHYSCGICTYCNSSLPKEPNSKCSDLWKRNYLANAAAIEGRKPIRLHSEELTAQTDNPAERQRHFRGMVVGLDGEDTIKLVDEIDMLSVTTTMEVGVDVGNLQAVMLANMPPMRFNYQQRVGRAGRRGQAFSIALTLCRGRSHDEFYFKNPERITGDMPPIPFITKRPPIVQRLMAKECLRKAFQDAEIKWWDGPSKSDSHGEFGKAEKWNEVKNKISVWLETNDYRAEVVASLLGEDSALNERVYLDYLRKDLSERIEKAANNPELSGDGLAERLAEGSILPMYGMPSRTRLLYHYLGKDERSIDRDLDLAITEFAPGAQKTKDKRIHTAIGFTAPLLKRGYVWMPNQENPLPSRHWIERCANCGYTKTYNEDQHRTECSYCGKNESFKSYQMAIPLAFRTDLSQGKDAREDEDVYFGISSSIAESSGLVASQNEICNSTIAFSSECRVWRINDNSGNLFQGSILNTSGYLNKSGQFKGMRLKNQWILSDYIDRVSQTPAGSDERIAIASGKTTDVLRFRPKIVPEGLNLDPSRSNLNSREPNVCAKAAIYSAAFILRSAVATKLDIDSDEIEICNYRRLEIENSYIGEITMSDRLQNGAGFVNWIADNWKSVLELILSSDPGPFAGQILHKNHRKNCESACYDCIKNYRNMVYHGLLDWRLGMSYLRIMDDVNHQCGLDGNFVNPELADWMDLAEKVRDNFASQFHCTITTWGELYGFEKENVKIIINHPLWDTQNPKGILKEAIAEAGDGVTFLDTFNLLRRPGWCYMKLSEEVIP